MFIKIGKARQYLNLAAAGCVFPKKKQKKYQIPSLVTYKRAKTGGKLSELDLVKLINPEADSDMAEEEVKE